MTIESLEKFTALIVENPALIEALKASTDEASFAKTAVELGAANGCHFTAEQAIEWLKVRLHASYNSNGELDDKQLDAVSGGSGGVPWTIAITQIIKNLAMGKPGGNYDTMPIKLPDSPGLRKPSVM